MGIFGPPSYGIGASIRNGREMLCIPYAGFFNYDHSKKELPILFEIFFDMLLAAWGFGCVWLAFDFGFFKNFCLVFSLEYQKTCLSGQKQKNYFFLPSTFSLENWWEMQFSTTPLRSFSVLNLAWQIAPTLYYYETEFQIFWWCWTNLCWWLISSLFQIHKFFEVPWHTPNSPYDSSDRMVLDLSLYIVNVHVYLLEEWSKVTVRKTEIQADLRTQTTICW